MVSQQQTIVINGVRYDTHTGMRLGEVVAKAQSLRASHTSHTHHKAVERSKTLRRHGMASPVKPATKSDSSQPAQSTMIRRFAPTTHNLKPPARTKAEAAAHRTKSMDIAPTLHPMQKKIAMAAPKPLSHHVQQQHQPKPAHEIKERAVQMALAASTPKTIKKQSFFTRHSKFVSISTVTIALVLVAGWLTYMSLPNLSVRVAAAQAGIDAAYPSYQPSGYSLDGPVAYKEGEVSMNFQANGGPQKFAVTQKRSSWDSSALLQNFIKDESESKYNIYNDSGLTVYVFGTNAAWVNGGILHLIEGNAPLTNEQMRRIAKSM